MPENWAVSIFCRLSFGQNAKKACYQAKLKEKEGELREKEESNHMLRREMLEIINKYNNEKSQYEAKIEALDKLTNNKKEQLHVDNTQLLLASRLKQKTAECRDLQREVVKLRNRMSVLDHSSNRAMKIALILDAIDSIDWYYGTTS